MLLHKPHSFHCEFADHNFIDMESDFQLKYLDTGADENDILRSSLPLQAFYLVPSYEEHTFTNVYNQIWKNRYINNNVRWVPLSQEHDASSGCGKRQLGRPRCRWMDNIKMDLARIGWDGVDWIGLTLLGSTKCWESIEWLHNWWVPDQYSAP
jgi:hypothetical protein